MHTTHITAAGTWHSPDRDDCPAVCSLPDRPEDAFVVTYDDVTEDQRAELAAEYNPETEHVGRAPAWLPCGLMSLRTLGQFRRAHMHQPGDYRGRLEQQPQGYSRRDPDFLAWREGQPPTPAKQEWLDAMQADLDAGLRFWRVRILPQDLSDYDLYEVQRGYPPNAQFEDIRVLRHGEHDIPELLGPADYHTFGNGPVNSPTERRGPVVPVLYQGDGEFLGGAYVGTDDPRAVAFHDELVHLFSIAEPFTSWWARHAELHDPRKSRAA